MTNHADDSKTQKNSKTHKKNDIASKLSKVSSLGKKTDKGTNAKRSTNQNSKNNSKAKQDNKQNPKPKKNSGVSILGGIQDIHRYYIIWVIMVAGFVALFGRAYWLQIANADYYISQGDKLITGKTAIQTHRGIIYDVNGLPLAANAPLVTVTFSPYDYAQVYYDLRKKAQNARTDISRQNAENSLRKLDLGILAQASGVPRETLEQAVAINPAVELNNPAAVKEALPRGNGSKRLILLNKVTPEVANKVMALNFKAVDKEVVDKRYYLQPEPMAQVLGYMGESNSEKPMYVGRAGIEAKYEQELAGKDGSVLTLRAVQGTINELKELSPVVPGQDIHLTLDSRLQYVLYKELEELGRVQSARSSSGMIVDVQTGNVLAMASWPSFNTNDLNNRHGASERNRPVLDTFEPGSVMKPITVAAALESGKYSTGTLINTGDGTLSVGGYTIRDGGAYGSITMGKLIQKSSNVASAKIALSLPNDAIADMQRKFGFGQKTTLNLPAEAAGRVDNPTDMSRRATLAYGYGQAVTLAQLAQAYATLANEGEFNHLRLVKEQEIPQPEQIINPKHAKDIINMMISVTEKGGTAPSAAIDGYYVAGKTGTSRRASPNGGYYSDQYRNVFAGIAPATSPRFVVVVLAEDPRKGKYAGQTVAPVFAKVMKETLRLYNVPYDKPNNIKSQ